jgi:DNA sulfur modification protein DndB
MPSKDGGLQAEPVALPALRGTFGDWTYYSAVISLSELATRVAFADEIHTNKALSQLIQRSLKGGRANEIAKYLQKEGERFFNSLVVAVYGGSPQWVPLRLTIPKDDVPSLGAAADSLGVLRLNGAEKLFAVDGQHRLAGMKRLAELSATKSAEEPALKDFVSVLFISHRIDQIARTRRLFTTLNKTAVPVSKMERIALDENDVMAIIARRLVEEVKGFKSPRVAMHHTNNLKHDEVIALTTIGNLYDVLRVLFLAETGARKKDLEYNRPNDEKLTEFFKLACSYFQLLAKVEPGLGEHFKASDLAVVCKKYRREDGGSVYFRPIGLTLMTEVAMMLKKSSRHWQRLLVILPRELDEAPFSWTIWTRRGTIEPKNRVLCRNLLLYMCGHAPVSEESLKDKLTEVMGEVTELPEKLRLMKSKKKKGA